MPDLNSTPLLQGLLAPHSPEEFLTQYWPERCFAVHGALSRLPPALRCEELSSFDALAKRYTGLLSFGRGTRDSRTLNMKAHPAHLYAMGLTVYLSDIAPFVPGAMDFLRQLERELGVPEGCARITAFASPQEDGVSCHFDSEEVFSVQLQGIKRFQVAKVKELAFPFGAQFGPNMAAFDELYPQVAGAVPDMAHADFETIEMKPGSVLFVPRGTWHLTQAERDSFSLSIVLRPPTAAEVLLRQLHMLLLQDPQWRRPLYGAWGEGPRRLAALDRAQTLLAGLPSIVGQLGAGDLALPTEAQRLARIGRDTRFQKIPTSRIEVERREALEILYIKAWDRDGLERTSLQMEVPPLFSPVFQWLATSSAAFSAGELADRFPAVGLDEQRKILDVLTRAQFLRLLWFPVLKGETSK